MRGALLILVLLSALTVHAKEKSYLSGKLTDVVITDLTTTIAMPIGPVDETLDGTQLQSQVPLHLGVSYRFEILADDIVYSGSCYSKAKKNYGSDWVVRDPIEFRVEKGKLFLKRPVKGELRLALVQRLRVISKTDAAGVEQRHLEPLAPFAARQVEPECH